MHSLLLVVVVVVGWRMFWRAGRLRPAVVRLLQTAERWRCGLDDTCELFVVGECGVAFSSLTPDLRGAVALVLGRCCRFAHGFGEYAHSDMIGGEARRVAKRLLLLDATQMLLLGLLAAASALSLVDGHDGAAEDQAEYAEDDEERGDEYEQLGRHGDVLEFVGICLIVECVSEAGVAAACTIHRQRGSREQVSLLLLLAAALGVRLVKVEELEGSEGSSTAATAVAADVVVVAH